YLWAYMFWFGLGLGCLGFLLLHHVVGGQWGDLLRPILESGAATVPWLALLFVPLLFGLPALYPWARPAAVAADPLLRHKLPYLNVPFFVARAAACFAVWSYIARRLLRWGRDPSDAGAAARAARFSAPGIIVYFFTLTVCVADWLMSLEPHWYSTAYELILIIGGALSAMAFSICALALFGGGRRLSDSLPRKPFVDIGNLQLACVMLWAYLQFSQYLIIFSGNIPDEIAWYLRRQVGGWYPAALAMIAALFVVPFLSLLGRSNKARLDRLVRIAALLLAGRALELFWLIKPAFPPPSRPADWRDAAAALALGGAWLAVFLGGLMKRPSAVGTIRTEAAT
ncbi:MAG TPA: hypothetical protein VH309_02175, partial [Elusimicrobiota bacterium]|nr:hypothetical protein [Elusimicrobiota bacterium]